MENFEKESIMDFLDGQIAPKLTVYNQLCENDKRF
jgi:hypothetical protein